MTINIKIATDMHTMIFEPDFFSLKREEKEYLGETLYRTGNYILDMLEVQDEFKK